MDTSHVRIIEAQCFALCVSETSTEQVAHVLVQPTGVIYRLTGEQDVVRVIEDHLAGGRIVEELVLHNQPLSQRFFRAPASAAAVPCAHT